MESVSVNAVRMRNITKTFGSVAANSKVNLDIKQGEILSLLGENGSGKTTLMNMLAGIYYPDDGQIFVGEREVSIPSPKDAFSLGIGMIHQHFKLVDVFTAAENITLGLPEKGKLDLKAVSAKIQEICDRYGFDVNPAQKIYDMSVSQKQTVEIVKVLYRGADILILDEPTAGLDPRGRDDILKQIAKLHKERKITVILVSHSMEDIAKYVERIIVMNAGTVMYDGVPKDIFGHYKELEEIGLAAPQVTYVVKALEEKGFDIDTTATTVEEAKAAILQALGK